MTTQCLKYLLAGSLLSLPACAVQTADVSQVSKEINTLNRQIDQLSQQVIQLEQQNTLNAHSTKGIYLLPDANTPAYLKSQLGSLQMSLTNITADASGTRAMLRVRGDNQGPLPAFSALVVWGKMQGSGDNSHEVNPLTIPVSAPESSQTPSDVSLPLYMQGIQPNQLGFIRVHDVQAADPNWRPGPRSPFSQ